MSSPEVLAHLLARCALNDHGAFEHLYQHTSAKLYGLVLRIVREEQLARDVLQDGYVRIWNHAADFRPEKASAITWMGSIMRNRAIDVIRRRRMPIYDNGEHEGSTWSPESLLVSPEVEMDLTRRKQALGECLSTLSETQRQAIALAYFRGLTHEEMAHFMGRPLGTVKSWLRRGLLRLRDCLDKK
jgi:RNA polymerase sigma-70 factor (ECF subfamily)